MLYHIALASSSKGNCHLLSQDDGRTFIMIECGLPFNKIKDTLRELSLDIHKIKACVVTHNHQDHSRSIGKLVPYMPVYATKETFDAIGVEHFNAIPITPNKMFSLFNDFKIIPFSVFHNAPNPVNFLIKNNVDEYVLFITDTSYIDISFGDIRPSLILIEANFDKELMINQLKESEKLIKRDRGFETIQKERQLGDMGGHLSYQDTIKMLKKIKLGICQQVILTHVSPSNGFKYFAEMVYSGIDRECPVKQLNANEIETTLIYKKTNNKRRKKF